MNTITALLVSRKILYYRIALELH